MEAPEVHHHPLLPTFAEHAEVVMRQRDLDGVRGLDRELSRLRCHVLTASFAPKRLDEIGGPDIRAWLREMSQKPAIGAGPPRKLSRHTVNRCQSLVSAVFTDAVERELLATNPCAGVRARKRVDEADTRERWAYLTAAEQDAVQSCGAIPVEDRLMLAFSAHTGLRQGEWRHLELDDLVVDGDDPHVRVRYSTRRRGEKLPPKSGKCRVVPLLPPAVEAARAWLALLDRYAPENPQRLVFPTPTGGVRQQGKPLGRGGRVRAHYRTAGVKLRPYLHWHALRHTFATNLITGVYGRRWSLEEIQVVMGHSSITITQRYAHLGEDAIRRAARETVAAATVEAAPPPTAPPSPRPGIAKAVWRSAIRSISTLFTRAS